MNLTAYHPYPISNPSTQYHTTLMENQSIPNSGVTTSSNTTTLTNDFNNNLPTNNRRVSDTGSAKVTLPPISSIINVPQEQKDSDVRTEIVQSENSASLRTSPLVHKDIATSNSMNNNTMTPAGPGVSTFVQPMVDSRRSSATQQQQQININYATPRNGMAILSGISSQATPIGTPGGSPNNNYLANQAIIQQENEAAAYAIQQRQQLQQIQYQQQAQVQAQAQAQAPQQGYYYVVAPFQQQQQQQQQIQAQPQQMSHMIPMSITQQQIAFQKAQAQQAQVQQQVQQQRMAQIAQQQQQAISTYPVVVSMPHPAEIQQTQQPQSQPQNIRSPEFENAVVYQVPRQPESLMNAGQSILVPTTAITRNSQSVQKPTMTTNYVTSEGLIPVPTSIQSNLSLAVRLRKQCPVCGKICSRPSTLKTHYLIHTGDTPFKCPWKTCKKSFNVKSNMLRHLKSHQKKSPKVTKIESTSSDEKPSTENEKTINAIEGLLSSSSEEKIKVTADNKATTSPSVETIKEAK